MRDKVCTRCCGLECIKKNGANKAPYLRRVTGSLSGTVDGKSVAMSVPFGRYSQASLEFEFGVFKGIGVDEYHMAVHAHATTGHRGDLELEL